MTTPDHHVVIIGAGFAGIGTSIALQRAGLNDHVLIEEGDDVGGTWNWNTYPGVAVDIPSFSYQFSYERRTDWSRIYAPGEELLAYARHCADKYDVRRRVRFGTRVERAVFDEDDRLWRLTTDTGEEVTARFVVGATGALTQPKPPDIQGLASFAGTTMHTARWDHDVDLRGQRVGIIGTGASAVQVIPAIADEVAELTVFQRTPIWCLPKPDARLPGALRWALGRLPFGDVGPRIASQAFVEATFPLPAHFNGVVPLATAAEWVGRRYLRQQVRDPEVRDKLTPRYAVGCKRPSFHNEYLATFNRDDVTLQTSPIVKIDRRGVVTQDGRHDLDVLILATGFKVFEQGNMPPFPVTGRDGVDLERWWGEHRLQAYEGASVPGFPNFFTILGPYAYNGSSYFNLIETQARHIVRCLKRARRDGATVVEVTREANDRFFAEMLSRRGNQIFFQDSCSTANSYYFDEHGDVPFRPSPSLEVTMRSARFDLDDYRFAA
ncbi:NAD(P)/FAD-dependent oxidoreductase [Svornostia abyssi]|uniref:NAD(P)/FAD-dependent oxidoreductase n=1 Tax=Svornostia abyssi TaxID=2898438 RepID=A0ABY5PLV7_9ACTN|nr:NAD(P)/FAD-dependent oxidoreductase [Parviterribacteraceae bacterium J379]